MSYYERAILRDRHSHLENLALRQQAWAFARQEEAERRRTAARRIADALSSLRLRARRSLKGRRSLA